MMKKVFALLVAVMMLLSMGAAGAATNADQIGKYYEVDDTTGALAASPALTAGNTQQVYGAYLDHDGSEETDDVWTDLVWLNKTIAPAGTENLFDVTLEVVTAQKIEQVDLTEDAATVLVIDVSGSMEGNRLSSAKKAAQTFINTFANASAGVQRKIAIVKFSGSKSNDIDGAYTVQSWTDASSIDTDTNTSYCSAIDNLRAQGGTNIEAGLLLAENLLEDITTIKNKNIVLLTDGKPTYGVSNSESEEESTSDTVICDNGNYMDGDGSRTTCNTHDDVETLGASLNTAGIGMYAVFVGNQQVVCESQGCSLNASGEDWLRDDCGFATYSASDNDLDKLVTIFENISKQIAARAEAWEVTDPMGAQVDYVQVVSADENAFSQTNEIVTWDLKQDNTAKYDETKKTYTYTATYRIYLDTLKSGFAEGTFYPTNDVTPLTWVVLDADGNVTGADQADGGVKKAYFNVPSVQGYAAPIKKVDENGNALDGAEFTLVHSCNSCPSTSETWKSVTGTSNSAGIVEFTTGSAIPSGHSYTLTETKAPVGYVLDTAAKSFAVAYGTINGETELAVTNALEKTSVSGSKIWIDADNQDGVRPASITINLLADGAVIDSKTVTADDGWAWSFDNLPKYDNGTEIVYTITEDAVSGYTATVNGYNVTNTHTPATTEVSGTKTWNDNNNQDGVRPASITINLLADGTKVDSKTVTANDGWTWSFTNLPKYANGKEITYTITEDAVEGYTAAVNGYNVTNTHTPEEINVEGSKIWNDNNNQDGKRPESITIRLLADGEEVANKTVTAADEWKWSFTGLPKYKAGKLITYTITEDAVAEYESSVNGYSVTNTHNAETLEISGVKTWNDNDDQDGKRPESITIRLLADGEEVANKTVTAADEWKWSFTGLPKYKAGVIIAYTITEDAVAEYESSVNGYSVTNTHNAETLEISGAKTWNDNDDQDGKRPESITIRLLADGEEVANKAVTAADEWKWSFTGLPKYKAGKLITYSITEDAVEGYTAVVDGYNVTNTHAPEKIDVAGSKTWVGDEQNMRPESITINLLADGVVIDSKAVTAADGWKWSFTGLDKYKAGQEIAYTITEDAVKYYSSKVEGYNVTNTRNVIENSLSFPVTKTIEKMTGGAAPAPGTYTFDFELAVQKSPAQPAMMSARQAVTVPDESVTIQVGTAAAQTVKIGQSMNFSIDVEVTAEGDEWSNGVNVEFWVNEEDMKGLEFVVTEKGEAPTYWSYDTTDKTVTLDTLEAGAEITNTYNEGYITKTIPVSKTVVQSGNIVPGVNTFYFQSSLWFSGDPNFDSMEWPVVEVVEKDMVVDHQNGNFAITVSGAETVDAVLKVTYRESVPVIGLGLYEMTGSEDALTVEELKDKGWIYDASADYVVEEDGWHRRDKEWFYSFEDGSVLTPDGETADEINIVNTYTANTPPPQTGDNSNIALWIALMGASVLCFVALNKRRSA